MTTTTSVFYLTIILTLGSPVEISTGPFTKGWCEQLIKVANEQFKTIYLDGVVVEHEIVCKQIEIDRSDT